MLSNRVRTTLNLEFNGEEKELKVTFDTIDAISSYVDWASIPERLAVKGQRPITDIAKLVFVTLAQAGFEPDIDDIYDEVYESPEKQSSYIQLAMQICHALSPRGKKKSESSVNKQKSKPKTKRQKKS